MSTAADSATGRTNNPYQKIAPGLQEVIPLGFRRAANFRIADHTAIIPRADINWKRQNQKLPSSLAHLSPVDQSLPSLR